MVTTSVSSEIANTDRPLARRNGSRPLYGKSVDFLRAKNNRSKSVCTLFQRKHLNNQTVWPVIFGLTGPICARALKSLDLFELLPRGHHDWPVKPTSRVNTGEPSGATLIWVFSSGPGARRSSFKLASVSNLRSGK